ncbi:hypothetical protein BVC93_26780 [Mycobacterium sp. MS1601]|uniref:hypothetical protein n=1 Tax=Mycobacterium sp. MS1601 TaxID=1936029 RepID=UPI00097968BC|nr:hypothetical protein [Mycobacterium sp. MS1601]AQA05393.1 hypothetical protein BVC93_26780 [Mycobacterium sp. MS1601]
MPTGRQLLAMTGAAAALTAGVLLPGIATAEPTITSDEQGYVGTNAHCDSTQLAVAYGRTTRSLVAICTTPAGGYEYRGVRLSDEAGLKAAATAADGGFVVENEGATYSVTPQQLLVTAEDGKVVYRDTWVEYEQPRFTAEGTSTSTAPTTSSSSTATSSTTAIPTATVTVTVTAEPTG